MSHEIRIILADDHPIVRRGLRLTIEADPQLTVLAEANDGVEALKLIQELTPDIAVLDIDMPNLDGFGVAREAERMRLATKLVFLTLHGEADLFYAALDLGVKGYLLKDSAVTDIVNGIKAVAAGQAYVTPALTNLLLQRRQQAQNFAQSQPQLNALTSTERRILQLVAANRSSKEIAELLFIHYRTVENHRTNICQKLGLRGSNALLKFALQHKAEL